MNSTRNISSEHPQGVRRRVPRRSAATLSQRGFSLIEMMISITIGLMIVAALVGVVTSNSRSTKTNDRTSELQSNGRYALDHLKRELRHAGYKGYTWAEPNDAPALVLTNECGAGVGIAAGAFATNIRQGIWGANNQNPFSANCIPGTNYDSNIRSDVLVIRRVSNAPATSLTANTLYFRSSYSSGEVFRGTAPPAIQGQPVANFALQEYVYYIGRDDTNANVPALRRVVLQADGSMLDEMVVSGIEQMQVQYGLLDTASNTRYFSANNVAGASTDSPIMFSSYAWDGINSVRIWLLARNTQPETGYSNTTSYEMGDLTGANAYNVNDSFRRQLFTSVVQLRN